MKHFIIVLFSTFLFSSCAAQKPKGLYQDEASGCFACIHHDSIAIGYKRNPSEKILLYYYGTYSLEQEKLNLSKNSLRYENAIIEEVDTDYPGIEILLFEQQPFLAFGASTNIDSTYYELAKHCELFLEFDSLYRNVFKRGSKQNAITTDDGLIQIPMDTLSANIDEITDFFIIGCANFFSEVRIIAQPHTRYVIKQKSLYHRPMVPHEVPIRFDAKKNQIEITESATINDQPYRTFQLKHIGPAESCLGELRKRYPDL